MSKPIINVHGMKITNSLKRAVVIEALEKKFWLTDSYLGQICGVSPNMVRTLRKKFRFPNPTFRMGSNFKFYR
jgi:hypothetical protein